MERQFENKVVVVTGGTSGIGLATAKRFADQGASVYVTGRRQEELDKAVKAIGARAKGIRADMSKLADIDHLYDVVQQDNVQIDVLFANAGGGCNAPFGRHRGSPFRRYFWNQCEGRGVHSPESAAAVA